MPGYFDDWSPTTGLLDPRIGGWFGLTQGLLSAGAPSRMPTNLGGALAQGLGGMAQGTQSSLAMRRAALENQLAELNYGKQATLLGIARGALNGDQGQQAGPPLGQAGDPSQPPTGFQTGLLGDPNSPQMGAPPQPGPTASPPAGPAGGAPAQVGGFPIPPGMNSQSFALSLLSPEMSKLYAPTNEQKNSRDPYLGAGTIQQVARSGMTDTEKLQSARQQLTMAGAPDSDPRVQQIDAAIFKANYVQPIEVRGGNLAMQPTATGPRPLAFVPQADKGIGLNFGMGKDGLLTATSSQDVPGYATGSANITGREQRAKSINTVQPGVDDKGNPTWAFPAPTNTPQGTTPPVTSPVRLPPALEARFPAQTLWTPPYGPGRPVKPSLGEQEATDIKNGMSSLQGSRTEAQGVGVYRELLDAAKDLASGKNKFGPGTADIARLKAMASNVGIDMSGAQTAQDVMAKISNQIATSQLGVSGTGSDRQLESLLHANPNGEMTNDAIMKVVPMLQAQLDLKENRAAFLQKIQDSTGHAGNIPSALTTYNKLASPQTVTLGKQLAEASAAGNAKKFFEGLTPQQRALLPSVKKLDSLGAF
jgi:hypothetical protein